MTWRYMNPGLVSLLDSNVPATQYTGYEYSNTGCAFSKTDQYYGVTVSDFQQGDEFWAKFDIFIPTIASKGTADIRLYIPKFNGNGHFRIRLEKPSKILNAYFYFGNSDDNEVAFAGNTGSVLGIKQNTVNAFAFHVVYGNASTAKAELFFNGQKYTYTGAAIPFYKYGQAIVGLSATSEYVKFSNVIFSNEEVDAREQMYVPPASTTTTDMATMAGGMYTADTAGQTFLQTPDVSSIISAHGANSTITSFQVRCNPAYRTGIRLRNMVSLSKAGNSIAKHTTIAMGVSTTDIISDYWTFTDTTVSDIQNMQFGWKTAE